MKRILEIWVIFTVVLIGCTGANDIVDRDEPRVYAGFIEAEELTVAADIGGRVMALRSEIGAEVESGDIVVKLDDRISRAEVQRAEAGLSAAEARLTLAHKGPTASELAAADARLAQAEAAEAGACQAWEDAQAILASPQELDRRIALTAAKRDAASARVATAEALKDAAEIGLEQFDDAREILADLPERIVIFDGGFADLPVDLPQEILDLLAESPPPDGTYRIGDKEVVVDEGHLTIYRYLQPYLPVEAHFIPNRYWQAWVGLNTAQAAYEGVERALALLYRLRANPTQLQARVDETRYQCRQSEAQVEVARAEVDALRSGATAEEIAALRAQIMRAEAELAKSRLQLEKTVLRAPANGIVLEQTLEAGELATPGAPLMIIGDLDLVYLTLYLPLSELARIRLGQQVAVRSEGLPDRVFQGEVSAVGQEAEFPPQSVPQPDERQALVFSVRVRIPNADHALRPGAYVEAVFEAGKP